MTTTVYADEEAILSAGTFGSLWVLSVVVLGLKMS